MTDETHIRCRFCCEKIRSGARICKHCSGPQTLWLRIQNAGSNTLGLLGFVTGAAALTLAAYHFAIPRDDANNRVRPHFAIAQSIVNDARIYCGGSTQICKGYLQSSEEALDELREALESERGNLSARDYNSYFRSLKLLEAQIAVQKL